MHSIALVRLLSIASCSAARWREYIRAGSKSRNNFFYLFVIFSSIEEIFEVFVPLDNIFSTILACFFL
jgi:hypothetical protein